MTDLKLPSRQIFEAALQNVMLRDRKQLQRRYSQLQRAEKSAQHDAEKIQQWLTKLQQSVQKAVQRYESRPDLNYPEELPVSAQRAVISAALDKHQVIIVCGDTGSGKTTQLPKICMEAGRGVRGLIGHTQPRRLAARSVASRITEELGPQGSASVGYKIRFQETVPDTAYVKLMTDGILLAETQQDRLLEQYDTLIIDEAHERSLNIDFLLGYLKQLLPKRPDLKIVITSATLDPEKFADFFDGAPIIQVEGRRYPVEIRYRALQNASSSDKLQQGITEAVQELARLGSGDVLVFLPGERDIHDTVKYLDNQNIGGFELLPLFGRQSNSSQNAVFHPGKSRRLILATNVAETSLTVPRIHYVIDSGLARISRYNYRSKIQRLPIEPISQASANQRSGRCGRIAPGICIRLYDEADFDSREEFTPPEILRTNLASVILRMKALGLGDAATFPFLQAPDHRYIRDGERLLEQLGALDAESELTKQGWQLAKFPVDPRLAIMLLQASQLNCLAEILVIVSGLSIQDPRERPTDVQQAADKAHEMFANETSDFLSLFSVWQQWAVWRKGLSGSGLRKQARKSFLSWLRMREWQDVHKQLVEQAKELKLKVNSQPAAEDAIHKAILAGMLDNIGRREQNNEYEGARGAKFTLFPGSHLMSKPPQWLVAAEKVETRRVFARMAAKVEPEWIEAAAGELVKRSYSDPHWSARSGRVKCSEQVTLYGLTLATGRPANFTEVDPLKARYIFIEQALVAGRLKTKGAFAQHNAQLIAAGRAAEAKARRRDVWVDERKIVNFYQRQLPDNICTAKGFERWIIAAEKHQPDVLKLQAADLYDSDDIQIDGDEFPEHWNIDSHRLKLEYHFEPGQVQDGVTLVIPLPLLKRVDVQQCHWLVPGLRLEKLTALIRCLPKVYRRHFVPAPNFATAILQSVPASGMLLEVMAAELERMTGIAVPLDAWQLKQLPAHLQMNYKLLSDSGETLAVTADFSELLDQWGAEASDAFAEFPQTQWQQDDLTAWTMEDLPAKVEAQVNGITMTGIPVLVDQGNSIGVRVVDDPIAAQHQHYQGLLKLFELSLQARIKYVVKNLQIPAPLLAAMKNLNAPPEHLKGEVKHYNKPHDELIFRTLHDLCLTDNVNIRSQAEFKARVEQAEKQFIPHAQRLEKLWYAVMVSRNELNRQLQGNIPLTWMKAMADIKQQLDHLLFEGCLSLLPIKWLERMPVYLQAIQIRLDKLQNQFAADQQKQQQIKGLWTQYTERALRHSRRGISDPALLHYRWLLEELRVSLFAQELGTIEKVSIPRLAKMWLEVQI